MRVQTYHNPEYKEHTPSHTMVQQNKLILINISFTCMHGSGYTVGFQTLAVMDLQWASISYHCKRSLTSQATSAHHGRFPYEHYQHFPGRQLNSTFFPFLLSTFYIFQSMRTMKMSWNKTQMHGLSHISKAPHGHLCNGMFFSLHTTSTMRWVKLSETCITKELFHLQ